MSIRKLLIQGLFLLALTLNSLTVFAVSQTECCVKFYRGAFLPLACVSYLGGSILSLPERTMMRLPAPPCGPVNMPMPVFPFLMPRMPMMMNGYLMR